MEILPLLLLVATPPCFGQYGLPPRGNTPARLPDSANEINAPFDDGRTHGLNGLAVAPQGGSNYWWNNPNSPFKPGSPGGGSPPQAPSGSGYGVGAGKPPSSPGSSSPPIDISNNPFLSNALQKPIQSTSPSCNSPDFYCVPSQVCYNGIINVNSPDTRFEYKKGLCGGNEVCCRAQTTGSGQPPSGPVGQFPVPAPGYPSGSRPQFPGGQPPSSKFPSNPNQPPQYPGFGPLPGPPSPPQVGAGSPNRPSYATESSVNKYTGPINTAIPTECAAALKCVAEIYCTAEGVMSPTPVQLTREQINNKVPLTDCQDPVTGVYGKCCRDPDYKDPWPAGMMMAKGQSPFDDGQYRPEHQGPANPSYQQPPTSLPDRTIKQPVGVFNTDVTPFPNPSKPQPGQSSSGQPAFPAQSPAGRPTFSGYAPGQPAFPSQRPVGQPAFPGQSPPFSGQQPVGQPSFPGQSPAGQPTFPGQQPVGQPSFPGQSTAGQPKFPGQQPAGQPSYAGQSPTGQPTFPGQQPAGQPAFPGQSPAGQPTFPGQQPVGQPSYPGQSPVGQPTFPGQQPAGQPSFPGQSPAGQPTFPGQQPAGQPSFPGSYGQPNNNRPGVPSQFPQGGPNTVIPGQSQFPGSSYTPGQQGPAGGPQTQPRPSNNSPYGSSSNSFPPPFPGQNPSQPGSQITPGKECGVRRPSYTSGDGDTAEGEFPWHAVVVSSGNNSALCSGALISDNAVLTSAHCVQGLEPKDLKVKVGGQTSSVAAIVPHPSFDSGSLAEDQAVLALDQPLTPEQNVDKVCLPPPGQRPYRQEGKTCFLTGYGRPNLQGGLPGTALHKMEVNLVENKVCENNLKQTYLGQYFILNNGFTCALPKYTGDFCKVDIGSPLVCDRGDNHYELVGVYSWDTQCSSPAPAVIAQCDSQWTQQVLATPVDTLKAQQTPTRFNTHRPEDIDQKPGFALGYGK